MRKNILTHFQVRKFLSSIYIMKSFFFLWKKDEWIKKVIYKMKEKITSFKKNVNALICEQLMWFIAFLLSSKRMKHTLKFRSTGHDGKTLWNSAEETFEKLQWLRREKASFEMPLKIGNIRTIATCISNSNRKHNTEVSRWRFQFDFHFLQIRCMFIHIY